MHSGKRGYEATSIADLMHATGLQKGSLYKAFKDKDSLFMEVLDRYLQRLRERTRIALSGETSAPAALKAWLSDALSIPGKRSPQRGCFAINSLVELGPHDPRVAGLLGHHVRATKKLVVPVIQRGQRAGELRTDISASALGDLLFTTLIGLITSTKGSGDPKMAQRNVRTLMKLVT